MDLKNLDMQHFFLLGLWFVKSGKRGLKITVMPQPTCPGFFCFISCQGTVSMQHVKENVCLESKVKFAEPRNLKV